MATPVKQLLTSVVTSVKRVSPSHKKLVFSKSPQKTNFQKSPRNSQEAKHRTQNLVQNCPRIFVHESDTCLVNTPNKANLLKNGLNRCDFPHLLGKGSFGSVVKGQYKGNTVAVKVTKANDINEQNALKLSHKNVIKILEIIVNKGDKYALVLMEFYSNCRDLQKVLNSGDFNLERDVLVDFCKQITKGICYCHQNKILHLDLNPKNILVCENVLCKICDFGNCVKVTEIESSYIYKGTVAYTAPELFLGEKPSEKCDVYSMGITFWQMISKSAPYEFLENEIVIYKVVKFDFRPCLNLDFVVDMKDLLELCSFCWQKDPNNRPDVDQVQVFLNNLR